MAVLLVISLLANPIAGATAAAETSSQNFFQRSADYFGSMFAATAAAPPAGEDDDGLDELIKQGLFDPLLGTLGAFFEDMLKDERLGEAINEVLTEFAEDERIAEHDLGQFIANVLRDPRLSEVLGDVIADYLKDENLLGFLEQLTLDLKSLLSDELVAGYLHKALIKFLNDDRIDSLVFGIVDFILQYSDEILSAVKSEEVLGAFADFAYEMIDLFMEPLSNLAGGILEHPRVIDSIGQIILLVEALPEEYKLLLIGDPDDPENHPGDPRFAAALETLQDLFLLPLLGEEGNSENPGFLGRLVDELARDLVLDAAKSRFLDELGAITEFDQVAAILDEIAAELPSITEQIGAEVGGIIAHYAAGGADGPPGPPPDKRPGEQELEDKVEGQIGDFLPYWFDVLSWVLEQKQEDLGIILDRYFGEEAVYKVVEKDGEAVSLSYFDAIAAEATAALEQEWPDAEGDEPAPAGTLKGDLEAILDEHKSEFEPVLEELTEQLRGDLEELFEVLPKESLQAGLFGEVFEDKVAALREVLNSLIDKLLLEQAADNGGGADAALDKNTLYALLSQLLQDLSIDLPFDAVADLISKEDVAGIVRGVSGLIDKLPLEAIAPYLRHNADELGHTIAVTLLHGLADGIEAPEEDDPRREEIIRQLRSEERLRRFYVELGGSDPEKISAESSDLEIIMAVITEIAGEEERISGFLEELEAGAQPVTRQLLEYGSSIGEGMRKGLSKIFGPYVHNLFQSFSFFFTGGSSDDTSFASLVVPESIVSELKTHWIFAAEALQKSGTGNFIDESMASFLIDHDTVHDIATVDRFTVINHFFSEISGAEPLKELAASDFVPGFIGGAKEQLLELQPAVASLLDPAALAGAVNDLLAGLLPRGASYQLDVGSVRIVPGKGQKPIRLTPKRVVNLMADGLEEEVAGIAAVMEELIDPLASLPAEVLKDPRTCNAVDELAAELPESLIAVLVHLLRDQRLTEFMDDAIERYLDAYLGYAGDVASDSRIADALADALTRVLANPKMNKAIGDLIRDLLSDKDLKDLLFHVMHQSRIISLGYSGPTKDDYDSNLYQKFRYNANLFARGDLGSPIPESSPYYSDERWRNQYADHPLCPKPYPSGAEGEENVFYTFSGDVKESIITVTINVYDHYLQLGANNGLYYFTEVFLEWLDPDVSFDTAAPGQFLGDYLGGFFNEERARKKVAEPLAGLLTGIAQDLVDERDEIKALLMHNLGALMDEGNPLALMAAFLDSDRKLPAVLKDNLMELPFAELLLLLQDNKEIRGLLADSFAAVPLQALAPFIRSSKDLQDIVADAKIELNTASLAPFLRMDDAVFAPLAKALNSFPIENISRFLSAENRAFRVGYIAADLKPRFIGHLLEDQELISLQAEMINEKVEAADYCLAESIFNTVERIAHIELLSEFVGSKIYESLTNIVGKIKGFFSFK